MLYINVILEFTCNYRDTEVTRELSISKAPAGNVAAGEARLAAGERGVDGDGGGISGVSGGDGVKRAVGKRNIVVRKVEEVLDGEMFGSGLRFGVALFGCTELGVVVVEVVVPCLDEFWGVLHWSFFFLLVL